jgi:YidC/Oxa1 family membrane protein insertase
MLGTIPIVSPVFQVLLNSIGWVLAAIYKVIPNYGVAIIILTLLLRILVLPLGIKQIKSMGAMQALAPRINEIKKKYKGNNAKIQEETMRLYKEVGVNPLGGCLPLLLQFPILIAMYAVIRPPVLQPTTYSSKPAYAVTNSHLPSTSQLFFDVLQHENTNFTPGINLQCSAKDAGKPAVVIYDSKRHAVVAGQPIVREQVPVVTSSGTPVLSQATFDCGSGPVSKIPYFALLLIMIGTTFYQQLQMQRVSPPGAASQQQQTLLKIMPLMFGFIGFSFPAGLVMYWTIANLIQIGQQWFLLRAGHIGPEAVERQIAANRAKQAASPSAPAKRGWLATMMERAEQERQRKGQPPRGRGTGSPNPGSSRGSGSGTGRSGGGGRGSSGGGSGSSGRKGGSGGSSGKRPTGGSGGKGTSGDKGTGSGSSGSGRSGGTGSGGRAGFPRRPPAGRPKPKKPEGGDGDGS